MNDLTPPDQHGRSVTQWIGRHARENGFELDAAQIRALLHFERLDADLSELERQEAPLLRLLAPKRAVQGMYLWGGVGRGKSFLMDSFFTCAQIKRKRRIHFHRFIHEIHHALHKHQGQSDPMLLVARDIARDFRLICLDEFHITDITDAMLMRRLLEGLSGEGVVLATTSNFHPDELYLHGLQRNQFLPAIALIKRNFEVVNVDGSTDYRLRELEKAGVYHVEPEAEQAMAHAYASIVGHAADDDDSLEIEGRMVKVRRHAHGVAWFDFQALCDGPRGKADYIELARRYHTLLLSGVPRFKAGDGERLRRFVWLIDEFYDRRVKLIISAETAAPGLVADAEAGDHFQTNLNASLKDRLVSRLTEMQTREYLTQPHLP